MKEIELIEKRRAREKHFLQQDGTIVARMYDRDIHYLKNGKYEEIDNTLVEDEEGYVNKANDYKIHFKKKSKDSLMKIEKDNHYLDIRLKQSIEAKINKKRNISKYIEEVSYDNILDGVDVEYKTLSNQIKETIVLHHREINNINFLVDTDLKLELQNGSIIAKNNNDNIIFTIEKPYMIDSNGIRNDNIYYEIKSNENIYELELILDTEWLNSSEIQYPVYIDPTITNNNQNGNVYDTYIYPGDNGVDKNSQDILKAGVERIDGVNRVNRTLIKFDLPEIGTGSEIINASLYLIGYPAVAGNNFEQIVEIHNVTEQWTEENATWEQMNNKYSEKIEGIQFTKRSTISDNTIIPHDNDYHDITNLVKKWYRDTPNYGIMIKSTYEDEYIGDNYPAFFSKNNTVQGENPKPVLTITYRNQSGLESYMNYKTQSFTDGATYMNTYNGNLVGIFSIGATIGGKLPVILSLVYNTNDVILKQDGFKLSLSQKIKSITLENNEYLEYEDEDGTIHYFYKVEDENSQVYHDEDGLELTITKENNTSIMTDKYGNKKTFVKNSDEYYYLTEIEDISENKIQIQLDANNKITKIIDANNAEINITYSNNLTTITSPDSVTKISYLNNNITSIETRNGITNFTYDNNNLISSIVDVNGLKITYEYCNELPYRVKKITQYGLNDTLGGYFSVDYGFESTTITDNKGRVDTLIFNGSGSLSSSNNMSSVENINNAYSITSQYGDYGTVPNKKLYDVIPIKYVKNYMGNSSFETDAEYFTTDFPQGVSTSFSTDCAVSGNRSLKIVVYGIGIESKVESYGISVTPGKYYTFSGYFKSEQNIKVSLVGFTSSSGGETVVSTEEIASSDEFLRHDVTFYVEEDYAPRLWVRINFEDEGTIYIDDIQLEEGEVANNYNILENTDFSNGFSDWDVQISKIDYQNLDEVGNPSWTDVSAASVLEVVNINDNQNTALKINMNPLQSCSLKKTFPIRGKKGDVYDISFWIKCDGIVGNVNGDLQPTPISHVGNFVLIDFKPVGFDYGSCVWSSSDFLPNGKWQYFTHRYSAETDFDEIMLIFSNFRQANTMYITNLSFYKELNTNYYNYDDKGNVTSISDTTGRDIIFNYDKNNQLIGTTDPKGKHFNYEYDNVKTDRVLSAISAIGISNQVKYDSFGNPILTRISKKGTSELDNGQYKIRNKGTDTYLKAEYNTVLVESDSCSNTIWNLEKIEEEEIIEIVDEWEQTVTTETIVHKYFKIIYSMIPNYFINYSNNTIWLSMGNSNNLFVMNAVGNGSYHIKLKDEDKYLRVNNGMLEITTLIDDDSSFEFYFEVTDEKFIENSATYSEDGRFVESVTDSLFNKTMYETDPATGLVTAVTNANNQTTNYTYNDKKQITSVEQGNKIVNYSYNTNNLLSKISQGTKEYNFIYDDFLNVKKVMIGDNITLVTNDYEENNGNLLASTYGNEDVISYEYDEFDRIKTIHKMDKDYYYRYDSNGNLAKILSNNVIATYDSSPREIKLYDHTIKYVYDDAKRINEYSDDNFKINYVYDINNNVINKKYQLNTINNSIENAFNKDDMLTKSILDNQEINYQYDELGRLVNKNINNNYNTNYDYVSLGKRTSALVNSIQNGNNKYSYKYDKLNNIIHIYYNNELQKQYYYDDYNELIKEEDYITNEKIEYNYDNSGNLLTKTTVNMITDVIIKTDTYQYSNSNWEDQLTSYNGNSITYDDIGNPLTIGNSIALTWINGRSLNTYEDTTNNLNISYQYNINGIRTSKIVGEIETKYYLENSNIIYEQRGTDLIHYLYDGIGLLGIKYNNNIYYYIKNLQGDIIGILDSSYNQVVSYEYDSWGKVLSVKDSQGNEITDSTNIGLINPFRYRGYYYDIETKLYYLNSRYYNPEWGRFLNADGYISTGMDFSSNNMYMYCGNNPINNIDYTGMIFGGILNFAKQAMSEISNAINALSPAYEGAVSIGALDGPLPSADVVGVVTMGALTIGAIGYGIYKAATSPAISVSKAETKTEVKDKGAPYNNGTVIYRYGGTNPGKFVPTSRDVATNTGLSFSTVPKPGAATTTIEALNATGIVYAVKDGPTHISVYPVGGSVADWHLAGSSSLWTQAVKSVVVKWDGR